MKAIRKVFIEELLQPKGEDRQMLAGRLTSDVDGLPVGGCS